MRTRNFLALMLLTTIIFYSCSKSNEDFEAQGGLLPTHYVDIKESTFSPGILIVATGSSITFINGTSVEHSIVSDDSSTILSGAILPGTTFFYKKDTVGNFNYHCGVHPSARGTLILSP